MKLLVTGADGQLGRELMRLGADDHLLLGVDQDKLDITDVEAVRACVAAFAPDAVVNAAAYTAVDRAEEEREIAFAVNRDGAANLAQACVSGGIPLVHVSTDYVFDGSKPSLYVEGDAVAPLGIYGASKWAGEEAVRSACPQHYILRTSWVFSAHGNNFVKTMLRLARERERIGVVADQCGCPTFAGELARAIYVVLTHGNRWGTYHVCQPEATSWHHFAEAVFAEARRQGCSLRLRNCDAITTAQYPTPAERPVNSALDTTKFCETFGVDIVPWRRSLEAVIGEIMSEAV